MSEPEQAVSSLVDKEAEEENDYLQNVAQSSPLKLGLVHSSTTDTLDSVYLDPPITEAEVEQELEISPVTQNEEATIDVTIKESGAEIKEATEIPEGTEIKEPNPANLDNVELAFSIGEKDDRNAPQTSPPSLSKYFGTNTTEDDPFATDFFGNIPGLDVNGQNQTGALSTENDPLTAKSTFEGSETQEIDINEKDNNEDEVVKQALEKSDSSKSNHRSLEISNVKSIDFDLELDNNEQVETPVDIENKDDFESFTADLADIETMDALGMSPAAPSYMNDYFRQTSQADSFTRQISQTSGKSSSSHDHSSVQPDIAAEIEEQLQDLTVESIKEDEIVIEDTSVENAPVPLNDLDKKTEAVSETKLEHQPMFPPSTTLSPVDSPVHQPSFKPAKVTVEIEEQLQDLTVESIKEDEIVIEDTSMENAPVPLNDLDKKTEAVSEAKLEHQPMFPPSTTLSPVDSPVHQPSFKPSTVTDDNGKTAGVPPSPEHLVTAFRSMSDSGVGEDAFAVALQMSDSDREHDAWIPSESTKTILISMTTQAPGSFHVDKDLLCRPSLVITEPQGDPVRDLVYRYMGEQEALKRQVLTAESVSQDFDGLKQLMATGCYRSAINLTGKLITEAGQAVTTDIPVVHSPDTLQLWYCRFSLMMKLRMYNVAESEVVGFKNFDTPDIYYEYYPHLYTGKRGSMLPFGMRILHAELPHHLGRSQETLDRLYYLIAIVQKIIKNLDDGLAEDGSAITITPESRTASTKLWKEREKQVYYVIGNTLVSLRDYDAALSVYEILLEKDSEHRIALLSGMGRIHLQIGNLSKAVDYFQLVKSSADQKDMVLAAHILMNRGFEAMCQNNFSEAYQHFKQAVQANPSNTSAVNNMAVCCLYLGRLKEALKTLEALVHGSPDTNLHEGILFNLCTLYELESSRALHKKQALLDLVSKHKGDGFPVVCLKMA